ncbi:MAG: hypothetical protein MJ233_05255 [Mycoplasmoidaceae bacterium]|nr:hypothetical protein [Mycoplasmoidaceae bacterium]
MEYQAFIDSGQTFAPDEHNKCYTATRETPLGLETLTYYFNNKKLIKSVFYVNADQTQDISVYNYGYQEIVPEVPTDCRYDINTDESIPFSTPILTGEISSIDTANEFYLAIDCSKCEKATQ